MNDADANSDDGPTIDRSAADAPCVLVVDDHVDSALSLCALLRIDGIDASAAHDGRSALAAVQRLRPRVVLLDLGLPDMTGEEVARRLRAEAIGAGLLLVALTGWGDDVDRQRTAASGFDAHLLKPADPEAVLALIRPALLAPAEGGAPRQTAEPR